MHDMFLFSEAARRILVYDIIYNDRPVACLEVRRQMHRTVYFQDRQGLERATNKIEAWFKANVKYPGANCTDLVGIRF